MGSPPAREVSLAGHARRTGSRRLPVRLAGVLAILVALGLAVAAPRVSAIAADSTCAWYTVKPGNTLNDISMAHHLSAAALAQANHISTTSTLYVGQRLCIPTAWWSSAQLAPAVPDGAELALPPGILAGEPCTEDRAVVWTVPVSQWAVPPGCFGQIFYPNPLDYMVNGQVIGGFGWCNWWPEALLRDPNALSLPEHSEVRVGWPVFYHPVNGEHVGHYAFVESIGPNGWILISEMNMNWRGAGWARVNYRYIRVDYPGAAYLYPNS
jgi:LysM repeat protein